MDNMLNRKKKIILEPNPSCILTSLTRNIKDIRSNIVTVVGTEENIRKIESENPYTASTQKVISCGDKDNFQDRASTITEVGDVWSSGEALVAAEELGILTSDEALIMYKNEGLPGNYTSYKKTVKERNLIDKIERLRKFLSITKQEELKNVFQLKRKN